jgi:hypothetical protein
MPIYDCGDSECSECQRAFGPDRSKAIAHHEARARAYAKIEAEAERDLNNCIVTNRLLAKLLWPDLGEAK